MDPDLTKTPPTISTDSRILEQEQVVLPVVMDEEQNEIYDGDGDGDLLNKKDDTKNTVNAAKESTIDNSGMVDNSESQTSTSPGSHNLLDPASLIYEDMDEFDGYGFANPEDLVCSSVLQDALDSENIPAGIELQIPWFKNPTAGKTKKADGSNLSPVQLDVGNVQGSSSKNVSGTNNKHVAWSSSSSFQSISSPWNASPTLAGGGMLSGSNNKHHRPPVVHHQPGFHHRHHPPVVHHHHPQLGVHHHHPQLGVHHHHPSGIHHPRPPGIHHPRPPGVHHHRPSGVHHHRPSVIHHHRPSGVHHRLPFPQSFPHSDYPFSNSMKNHATHGVWNPSVPFETLPSPVSMKHTPSMPPPEFFISSDDANIPIEELEIDSSAQDSFKVQRNAEDYLGKYLIFKRFDSVEDCSDHHYASSRDASKQPSKSWAKNVQEEWKILENDLPDMIFVRVYESRMDLLRAVIIGAEGTPYHDGLFFFDVCFPDQYPNVPPEVHYHSRGLRINPNLYDSGKVCLSLLGTWIGDEKESWIPGVSTMLQVLVSIQALILNQKPYFNEPGFEYSMGTPDGESRAELYSENAFVLSLRTIIFNMRSPPKHFEDFVYGHFFSRAHDILAACKAYTEGARVGHVVKSCVQDTEEITDGCPKTGSKQFRTAVSGCFNTLVKEFALLGVKDTDKYAANSTTNDHQGTGSSSTSNGHQGTGSSSTK